MSLTLTQRSKLLAGPYTRLLAEHEQTMKELYEELANLFPRQAAFWRSFAREEGYHKNIVLALEKRMHNGSWEFSRPSFPTGRVIESINWVRGVIDRVTRTGISMSEALALTLQMERSMIEASFFKIIADDAPETAHVLEKLSSYTAKHARKLAKEAGKMKWRLIGWRLVKPQSPAEKRKQSSSDPRKRIQQAQTEIVGMLVALEEAAGRLYELYASRLPLASDFWNSMHTEEEMHASMLRKMLKTIESGSIFSNIGAFNATRLQTDIESIMHAESRARTGKLTGALALSTAISIEQSMAESKFYNTVSSDSPEFSIIAKRLVRLTQEHIERVRKQTENADLMQETSEA